jgi:hypothetical protein
MIAGQGRSPSHKDIQTSSAYEPSGRRSSARRRASSGHPCLSYRWIALGLLHNARSPSFATPRRRASAIAATIGAAPIPCPRESGDTTRASICRTWSLLGMPMWRPSRTYPTIDPFSSATSTSRDGRHVVKNAWLALASCGGATRNCSGHDAASSSASCRSSSSADQRTCTPEAIVRLCSGLTSGCHAVLAVHLTRRLLDLRSG